MKMNLCLLTLTFFAAAFCLPNDKTAAAIASPQTNIVSRCTVNDSTGTPLNVRSTPGGKRIVAKLKNGAVVFVENYSSDAKDQSWAEVRLRKSGKTKPVGWVLQDFLVCEN